MIAPVSIVSSEGRHQLSLDQREGSCYVASNEVFLRIRAVQLRPKSECLDKSSAQLFTGRLA